MAPSDGGVIILSVPTTDDKTLAKLKIPTALRARVVEILEITDATCIGCLDAEYADISRELVGRMARKRPSPLARGNTRIWAAAAIYAIGQLNFLSDPAGTPHLTADELAGHVGVVKSTMANKAALIRKTLNLGVFEPGLTRVALIEQHPMAWIVELNGFLVDARTLPAALQVEARAQGLIPELDSTSRRS